MIKYLTLLCLLVIPGLFTPVVAQTPITDRDISLTLVTTVGAPVVGFSTTGFRLISNPHTYVQGERIDALIRANGIFPDTDAYGLVYDLNPGLASLDSVAPGTQLLLPKVVATTQTPPTVPAGALFTLVVDKTLKDDLVNRITAVEGLAATVASSDINRFKDAADRTAVLAQVNNVKASLGVIKNVIRGKVRPLSSETLNQIKGESELLQIVLSGFAQPGQVLTACDRESLSLIDGDLMVKRRTLTDVRDPSQPPTRWREVRVVVKTLRPGDGSQVPNLRIFYAPEALYGRRGMERSFDRLSSPSDRIIPEANYRIWAGRGGDPTPVSEVKRLEVRQGAAGQPISVDLIVP